MQRLYQIVFISCVLGLSWLLMQALHEFGHVLAAWMTGGTVTNIVLNPLTISRTDVEPNPQPLSVAWGGPALGIVIPLLLWGVAAAVRLPVSFLTRFFAGFCLMANGLYLGVGSFGNIGDAGDILRHGCPLWTLWLFGLISVPAGLMLWNGLGSAFGIAANPSIASAGLVYASVAALIIVVAIEMVLFSSQ